MNDKETIFGKCKHPQHAGCQKVQEIKIAVYTGPGMKLKNRCGWCRGEMREATDAEIRENGGKP